LSSIRVLLVGQKGILPPHLPNRLMSAGLELDVCESAFDALCDLDEHGAEVVVITSRLADITGHQFACLLKSDDQTASLPIILIHDSEEEDAYLTSIVQTADATISADEIKDDPEDLIRLINKQIVANKERGGGKSPAPLVFASNLRHASADTLAKSLLDDLLIERLVAKSVRNLSELSGPRQVFVDAFFRTVAKLMKVDMAGIVIATLNNPWGAFGGLPGLSRASFDQLLDEVKSLSSISKDLELDLRFSIADKSGLTIGDRKVMVVAFEKTGMAILTFANYGNIKKLSRVDHVVMSSLKSYMKPLMYLLINQQELETMHTREAYFASIDPLTGLYNLEFLVGFLQQQLLFSFRQKLPVGLLLIDLDNFAELNNRYGMGFGDAILTKIASRLLTATRSSDLSARYGGDEFAIVLPNTDVNGARILAEKLRLEIENMDFMEANIAKNLRITVSVGCSQFDLADMNPETILRDAKVALQKAKEAGKNRVSV
jgi:diguanylate cyclase (GGDEF)-like protein